MELNRMTPDQIVRAAGRYCNAEPRLRLEMLEYLGLPQVSYLVILIRDRGRDQTVDSTLVHSEEGANLIAQHKAAEASAMHGDSYRYLAAGQSTSGDYPDNASMLRGLTPEQAIKTFNRYAYGMTITIQRVTLFQ